MPKCTDKESKFEPRNHECYIKIMYVCDVINVTVDHANTHCVFVSNTIGVNGEMHASDDHMYRTDDNS
jgi:hypothetical protein